MLNQFKLYQQELLELGKVVEKIIQEYYQHKGEAKDYNNDFDNFLRDIVKVYSDHHIIIVIRLNRPPGGQIYEVECSLCTSHKLTNMLQSQEAHVEYYPARVQGQFIIPEKSS